MIREIQGKVLLSHVQQPDEWFGMKDSMNVYLSLGPRPAPNRPGLSGGEQQRPTNT